MEDLGRRLAAVLRPGDLILLTGRLGAGKTTLTRGIGEGLGVRGPVTSPTFVLARTHPNTAGGPPLVHVDAYRLGSAVELDDLDIDFARSVVVMEWGVGLVEGLADSWLDIRIERPEGAHAPMDTPMSEEGDDLVEQRTVLIAAVGERWAGIASALAEDQGNRAGSS
ncbi:tRNA (adenosine(37)-N6)-threonylcarbamoyltransferase complex ATPase subunit type 1 TsaE [Microbacteriaceae bacterium 4G12]